jgi:hypothetical protein
MDLENGATKGRDFGAEEPPEDQDQTPMTPSREKKQEQILEACSSRDVETLVQLATSEHGLLHDELRRAACKLLAGNPPNQQILPRVFHFDTQADARLI